MDFDHERAGKLFDLADVDKSGSLCCDEVKGIMTRLKGNIAPSEVELKNAFFAMDKDGNGKIEKHEFMAAMSEWMHSAAEVQAPQSRLKRPLGSPPTSSSRKKAANSMANFFNQFAGADAVELRRRIENHQPPGAEINVNLDTVLNDYPDYSVIQKLAFFDEATEQMKVSGDLLLSLHNPQWEKIEEALLVVGKFLEVVEVYHFLDEKIELWPFFDQIFHFFTTVESLGHVGTEPISIIRRVAQLLHLPIPASKQVQLYTLCLKALANYIPGPGYPCPRDSHWHPSAQLTRNIMRHEQLIPSLYNILKEHGRNLSSLETVRLLEAHAKCLRMLCQNSFEMTDIAVSEFLREGVRMLLEAIVVQKEGPCDVFGNRHSISAFAPLLQNLLGALSVLCGFTHDEAHSNFDIFKIDEAEATSIMRMSLVCIEFLTNCQVLRERQVAVIHISIIWQHLLIVLPTTNPLFASVVNENIRLLGLPWDLSPTGVQVVVNLLLSAAELMEDGTTTSAVYIALWDQTQSNFKNNFRHQFQIGYQGGMTTWPICQACYHVLDLLLQRGQHDHLLVPAGAKDPLAFFGAVVFQQSRFLLLTAEDPHVVIDFLCKCLEKSDLIETLLSVGLIDAFFEFFTRFKTNHDAISDIFNKHVVPTYEVHAMTDVIVALKLFLERHVTLENGRYNAFTLDHMDAAELLHVVICRELRRYRLRLTPDLEILVAQLEELVEMIVALHVAAGSALKDVMEEELKVMRVKWPKDRDEAYKLGISRTLPKSVWMDIRATPLWVSTGIKGFDKGVEPAVFKDLSVVGVDYDTLKNELGRYYKRPVHIYATQNETSLISNQEDWAKHLHSYVKIPDSTDKIFVDFYVNVDEGGVVISSQNYFNAEAAVGISHRQAELKRLLTDAGNDKKKLQSNQTIERFYDYFKSNGMEVADEATFIKLMTSATMGFEPQTAKSVFDVFDSNRDGGLSIKEIAIGFSQLSCDDSNTQLKALFDIYDADKNGKLDENELVDMIVRTTGISFPDAAQMTKLAITKPDKSGDLMLDFNEFSRLARSGVIDLGIDFTSKRDKDKDWKNGGRRKSEFYGHENKKGDHRTHHEGDKVDARSSQLCSFLFTKSGCSNGGLCSYKHGDISQASRGDKERVKKSLEKMKRKDINYDALK